MGIRGASAQALETIGEQGAGREIAIGAFGDDDAGSLLRLAQRCLARPDEQLGTPLWATRADLDRELSAWPTGTADSITVAREDGELVGFVAVECYDGDRMGLLHGPIVDPNARGHRIGRVLLDAGLRSAARLGVAELWASVGRENARGDRMLRLAGFERGEMSAVYRLERPRHRPLADERLVELRRVGRGDVDETLHTIAACCNERPLSLEEVEALLADDACAVYLAGDAPPMGVLAIDDAQRWITAFGVAEAVRGRGFAGAMLSKALGDYWSRTPDACVGLTVRLDNLAAINLYRRQGFEPWLVVARYRLVL